MPSVHFLPRIQALLRKRQLLMWLAAVSLVFGAAEFGEPLDLTLHTLRNKLRAQPVSGEVVVVGIDDKSLARIGPWPWNRARLADLTQNLFESGANRVFFDIVLNPGEPKGDTRLVETMAHYPGRVFAANGMDQSGAEDRRPVLPMPQIAQVAQTVSDMKFVEFWNGVQSVPYGKAINGAPRHSMEAVIAGVTGDVDSEFPIDYSYRVSSIPYVSAEAALAQANHVKGVAGKDIIIGMNSPSQGDMLHVLGQGHAARVFIVALGAETLLHGRPLMLGWMLPWLFAFGVAACLLYARNRTMGRLASLTGLAMVLALPLLLENFGIVLEVAPALFLIISSMISLTWLRFGARKKSQGATNPLSGLPTATAILHGDQTDPGLLVAARVRHFTDIVSALPPTYERELLKQIVTRLSLGTAGAQLLHGDDGNFFWLAPAEDHASVVDQFKALQLIFRTPIAVADRNFDVDVAFGLDQEVGVSLSHRIASALAAAHAASEQGVGWKVHDPAVAGAREWTLSLLGELDQAMQAGHIWVAYQPKMDLETRQFIGAEALVRWTHATKGPINPAEFVEIADKHGRIGKITGFVLEESMKLVKQARLWDPAFTVSVNVSPSQLISREIVEMVRLALARHQLPTDCLILEVTETATIVEGQAAQATMEELRSIGVGLSIDDYGTGMSTLEYLRRIPANELKVDRRFVSALASSVPDQAVVRSTIELAHALNMKVVVEGIETAEILYLLAGMGCDVGQGYHIGRPMDGRALIEFLGPPPRRASNG